jgi:TatD DNase family protein
MDLFDSHCHIDLGAFDDDRDQVLAAARAAGVTDLLVPGVERRTWDRLVGLCQQHRSLHLALGLHPVALAAHGEGDVRELAGRVASDRPLAVGEIGLDWQAPGLDRERQQSLFEAQLEVAAQAGLPVVLHVRKAHDRVLQTLRRYRLPGGFCHAFNGSLQQAGHYIERGFVLGFGGMLTFERSARLRRLAGDLPLESLVLETDAPDMTVASHRYQRNSPAYLPEVLQALANVRREPIEQLAAATTSNTRRVLGLACEPAH